MSAPHQEMHELTAEVGPVARAMLSAALAVVQARQQRRLTAARAAEAAQRASGERADGPPDRGTGAPSPPPSAERGTVGTPPGSDALRERPFSRRATQETADTMVATPGAAEADTHLRGVVRDAVPALADRVLAEESWPALRASLHHIEAGGGNPRVELVAAAGTRTLDTSKDLCRVLSWRLANQTARTTPPRAEAAAQAQAQSVLHALATDPVGTAHAYADAQLHRDTHPQVASAWDEALRTEHIDPHQVADDATAAAVRLDKAAPTAEHDTNFDEEYLGALHELGVDIDAGRQQLAAPGTRTSGQSPATSPAGRSPAGQVSGRTGFSEGSPAAQLAGKSHPRSIRDQLQAKRATRTAAAADRGQADTAQQDPGTEQGRGTRSGAFGDGSAAAQLAGKSHPRTIREQLATRKSAAHEQRPTVVRPGLESTHEAERDW